MNNHHTQRRKSYQGEVANGRVETEGDILTSLTTTTALPPRFRRGRRQTLAITDDVNVFGRRRVLSPSLRKRSSELDSRWKSRRSPELLSPLLPGQKKCLPFLLVEIELENGGNMYRNVDAICLF